MKPWEQWTGRAAVHEVSVALGIVDEVMRIARQNNARRVLSVRLKIGQLSGIQSGCLRFAFDAVKLEHPVLSSAEILISEIPLRYRCVECGRDFDAGGRIAVSCEACGGRDLKVISGEEQHLENVELEIQP
ncbi:MAG: hydrogenase maturation nickel metallochaperone HypA [Deferribacteres bacterium]|nr:hydrogenase maturation nickel metallochaperone HypA [Deferribacteres bacterium]